MQMISLFVHLVIVTLAAFFIFLLVRPPSSYKQLELKVNKKSALQLIKQNGMYYQEGERSVKLPQKQII